MLAELFTAAVLEELFVSLLKGSASGIGNIAIQPAAKGILSIFERKFKVKPTKMANKIYKAYNNSHEISENVCEWVMFTIKETFQKDSENTVRKLMKSIKEPDKFKGYLIDSAEDVLKNTYFDDFNKNAPDYIAYTEIIGILVEEIYKPDTLEKYLVFLNENQRDVLNFEMIGEILTLISMMKNSTEDKLDLILSILTDNYKLSAPEITDRNIEYIRDYYEPLFLEEDEIFSEGCTDNIALLEDAFVEPMLSYRDNLCSVIDTLKAWAANTDRRKRGMNAKIFLLYGKAGDGKTSLVSRILAKNILGEKCHAVALRNCIDTFSAENKLDEKGKLKTAWQLVNECFGCNDDEKYKGKILILDGLDEVCVLQSGFNGKDFLDALAKEKILATKKIKILVTSRDGNYFSAPNAVSELTSGTLLWTEEKVEEWCTQFGKIHECRKEWCREFPGKLASVSFKSKDAFYTPIILYICCVCKIDISKESSIAGIYDNAFKKIGYRKHDEAPDNKDLVTLDERQHKVNWQYTKELAFQMFLNGKLEAVVAENDMNESAVKRTKEILGKDFENIDPELEHYFAICHFTSKKGDMVEFVHKTMGDYFTAVKLYEDYFGKLFQNGEHTDDETVWKTIFQAFRYKEIPEDIIDYLVDITEKDNNKAWKEKLFRSFHEGMTEQYWWKNLDVEPDYKAYSFILTEQVYQAFANLTWYFTKLGFAEYDREHYKYSWEFADVISSYFHRTAIIIHLNRPIFYDKIYCPGWKCLYHANLSVADLSDAYLSRADLSGANLSGANLSGAHLNGAHLSGAYLRRADLSHAHLSRAHLRRAYLSGTNLRVANLSGAYLSGAYLSGADLSCADLSGADLSGADLSGADLSGAKLNRIKLYESDLPKWDEPLREAHNKLIYPIVYDDETCELITDRIYNPETNRMEYPKDNPKGD